MNYDTASLGSQSRRLNVLFVAGFDSANYAYVELIRELESRGHRSTVLVRDPRDTLNNKMFANANIPTVALSSFDLRELDSVDFVFCGPFNKQEQRALIGEVQKRNIFMISFSTLFSSVTMRVLPDLLITAGESRFREFADNGLVYNAVAIGNPEYDRLVRARESRARDHDGDIRKVLVVDQGAYPLGDLGKTQLASALVALAANNPQMTFQVKPRYLPDEVGEHLHAVSEHLYTYLAERPDNLVLLDRPTILEDLLPEFDAMITTWSTAYLGAVVLDMPLLLIGGLDSVDVYDVRRPRIAAAYEHLRATGCVVDWRDLLEGECKFARVTAGFAREEFDDPYSPCAPKIVDLLERLDEELVQKHRAFSGSFQLSYSDFVARLPELATADRSSEDYVAGREYLRRVNDIVQALAFDNRCLGFSLDMQQMLPLWSQPAEAGATGPDIDALERKARQAASSLKETYFRSSGTAVESDVFVQDAFFDWLRATRKFDELLGYQGAVVARESLAFNQGLVYAKHRAPPVSGLPAADRVVRALACRSRSAYSGRTRSIRTLLSGADTDLRAIVILWFLNHHRRYEGLSMLDVPGRPNLDALVYYTMKSLVAVGRPGEARTLYEEYTRAIVGQSPSKVRGRVKRAILALVIAVYRMLARRLAARLR